MIQNILVVCIGNICRSPMAEGLLRARLAGKTPKFHLHSAGLSAMVGWPADTLAQEIMLEKTQIDIGAHRAKQVTIEVLSQADLILVMENSHQKQIQCHFPTAYGKVHRLGRWGEFDIPDPYRQPKNAFLQTFMLIEKGINEWQAQLWK